MLPMIRYDAAAGHVVLFECHNCSFSAAFFNDSGLLLLLYVVHWSCQGFFFGQIKHFLYAQVPGVDIIMDYYYGMVQHPADQYTHLKVQEIPSCMLLAVFSCPILVYFCA